MLRAGLASFSMLSFDAQGSGEAFRVDVAQVVDGALRRRPASEEPVDVPGQSWPIQMSFMRGGKDKPASEAGAAKTGAAKTGASSGSAASAKATGGVDTSSIMVRIVPGITRYHKEDCLLIRFLAADDLEVMSLKAASDEGYFACKACKPDQIAVDSTA